MPYTPYSSLHACAPSYSSIHGHAVSLASRAGDRRGGGDCDGVASSHEESARAKTSPLPDGEYSLSPSAIGARYGYILSSFLRLVPADAHKPHNDIVTLKWPCWGPFRRFPTVNILSPLLRLVPAT
eukprot:4260287-Pyramimonas_sp.AAC.1